MCFYVIFLMETSLPGFYCLYVFNRLMKTVVTNHD
jgi:hypothetical protein